MKSRKSRGSRRGMRAELLVAMAAGLLAPAILSATCYDNVTVNTCTQQLPPPGYTCIIYSSGNTCVHNVQLPAWQSGTYLQQPTTAQCTYTPGTLNYDGSCKATGSQTTSNVQCQAAGNGKCTAGA
jgi:hypothetical protein